MASDTHPTVQQPKWYPPPATAAPKLKLTNSLTRAKEDFTPANGTRTITWYNCGPTVYDASHLGHARLYVTIDIMRRILEDYFHYNVNYVMNITDIDDKIIIRSRQNHLFEEFKQSKPSLTIDLINYVRMAWEAFARDKLIKATSVFLGTSVTDPVANFEALASIVSKGEPDTIEYIRKQEEKLPLYITTCRSAINAISTATGSLEKGQTDKASVDSLLDGAREVIAIALDNEKGHTITDQKIFRNLAAYWEREFLKDMDALNVRRCTVMTRVSEYIPEIGEFVKKIIDKKLAYVANDGSVYFDTQAFRGADVAHPVSAEAQALKHSYLKLQPWSAGNANLIAEGEGTLGAKLRGKKTPTDFALWKASKPGEPFWEVEGCGKGRPGWHIECSVMASSVLGSKMDIHSGGIDLAFPHHDNELGQSEAYHGCEQWVNYFLHVGHLHIDGLKMSKSLKNFVPIREALEKYSARQLRMRFLMNNWESPLDFRESGMNAVINHEKTLQNFFAIVRARTVIYRSQEHESTGTHNFRKAELGLVATLQEKQNAVHVALCDSLDTPRAWEEIMDLVSKGNIYIVAVGDNLNVPLLENVAKWVTRMCKLFGLADNADGEIGFGSGESHESKFNLEETVMPYLQCLSRFRDEIRALARGKGEPAAFLALCDKLRDEDLVDLGVALDDYESGRALVKLVPREDLLREQEEKSRKEKLRLEKKKQAAAEAEAKRRERLERGRITPANFFREHANHVGNFSLFDDQGLPTHDAAGEELSKSRRKKLTRELEAHRKLHEEFLEDVKNSGGDS